MTNEEKPAGDLPPLPWHKSEFRASREEPVIEITDADGKPIAWIPQRWEETTEGNRAYDFPQSEALAALLLRAPQLKQERDAARALLAELADEILATAREFDGVASSAARFNHCLRLAREFKRRAEAAAGGGEGK